LIDWSLLEHVTNVHATNRTTVTMQFIDAELIYFVLTFVSAANIYSYKMANDPIGC